MDEATSSIDIQTEELITKAMDIAFKNSTLISVAHRVNTIINMDKIIVLDKGKLEEFGSP